jgi:hypothetical protein
MKHEKIAVWALLMAALLTVAWGCAMEVAQKGKVTLQLNAGTGSKTILPSIGVSSYLVNFTGPVAKPALTTGEANPTIELEAGSWDISVEGRDAGGNTVAVGNANGVVVASGATTSVSILLIAQSSGSGQIDVTVSWPAGESVDQPVEVRLDGTAVDPGTLTSGATWVRYQEGKTAGSYRVSFILKKNGVIEASVQEAVQVYGNLSSSAVISLSGVDFSHAPAAPSGLVVNEGQGKLVLGWVDNSSVENGYQIQRGTDGVNYGLLASISAPATSYEDASVVEGVQYSYRVVATNDFGSSAASEAAGKYERPAAGGGGVLSFSGVSVSGITVEWAKGTDNASSQGALGYKVVRSTSDNVRTVAEAEANGTVVREWTTDVAAATASGLSAGTAYYFNVLIRDEGGNTSCYSEGTSTTTSLTGALGLTITIQSPQDETMTFSETDRVSIIVGSIITVTISQLFDTYEWVLDGQALAGQNTATATIDSSPLLLGVHNLTAFIQKNGNMYSKSLRFSVGN